MTNSNVETTVKVNNERKTTMENKKEFNVWTNTYELLVKEFINKKTDKLEIIVKYYNSREFDNKEGEHIKITGAEDVLKYIGRYSNLTVKGIEPVMIKGNELFKVKVEGFDIDTKVPSKFDNGEYYVFEKAYRSLMPIKNHFKK